MKDCCIVLEAQRLTTFQKHHHKAIYQWGRSFVFDNAIFVRIFPSFIYSVYSGWKSAQLLFFFCILTSTQRPPPCSHINFRKCSLYRWYATIFYSLSHFANRYLLCECKAKLSLSTPFFRFVWTFILQRCYMKGEMKCRSCTHVHARSPSMQSSNLFFVYIKRLDYIFRMRLCLAATAAATMCVSCPIPFAPLIFVPYSFFTHSTKTKPFTALCSLTLAFVRALYSLYFI